ncbi:MAG TPA: VCBS domain-containing protein [Burkholderiales bacterium]|nr:VCBS domain-containing protein [Burkholderiales bacterium]
MTNLVTIADFAAVKEDSILSAGGNVLANDREANPGTLLSLPYPGMIFGAYGHIELFEDGSYVYTLDNTSAAVQDLAQDEVVEEVYVYAIAANGIDSAQGSLTVRIAGSDEVPVAVALSNGAPVTVDDAASVQEDVTLIATGNVLLNDSDPDAGDVLTVANFGPAFDAYGRLDLFEDGRYQYTLDNAAVQSLRQGEVVEKVYIYAATDSIASTPGSLTIRITGTNDAPVTVNDAASVQEDVTLIATGNVLLNDTDPDTGDVLTVANFGPAFDAYGRLDLFEDGRYQYTLDNAAVQSLRQGEVVEKVYMYAATDSIASTPGSLTIRITGTNDAPVTVNDAASVTEDGTLTASGNVLTNDSDVDTGTVLRVAAPRAYSGNYGTLALAEDGSYTYTLDSTLPAVQALGLGERLTDVFGYAASDGITATAGTLTVVIGGANDAPATVNDSAAVQEDVTLTASGNVLANDSDPDAGAVLHVAAAGDFLGMYGSLTLDADGGYSYTLAEASPAVQSLRARQTVSDVFTYLVSDGIASTPGTLTISVAGSNDAPVTVNDTASAREDTILIATGNVLANDRDVDAGTVLVAAAGSFTGTYGSLALNADGSYTYTLANASTAVQSLRAGQAVTDSFSYSASDGIDTTPGTLSVSVLGTNDAPLLVNSLTDQNAQVGAAFSLAVPANTFTDIDQGDTLSYGARTADGSALPSWLAFDPASRTFSGTPGAADAGTLQVRLTATDLGGASADDMFAIAIEGASDERTFNFQVDGVWPACDDDADRRNVGSPGKPGTGKEVSIAGKNRTDGIYVGGAGSDTLNGTSGADALLLDDGAKPRLVSIETINMGDGDDVVDLTSKRYTYGDVTVNGNAGKDVIWTSAGNDVLDGGAGDDALAGGAGNDVYVHGAGGGKDVITETGGFDTILFGAGIGASSVTVRRQDGDLVLSAGENDSVTVKNWFGSESRRVETVQFADGTAWNEAQLSMRANCGSAGWDGHSGAVANADRSSPGGSGHHTSDHHDGARSTAGGRVTHAAQVIAALLNKKARYDFGALTAYIAGKYGDSSGRPLSVAEIGLKWRSLQRFAQGLAQVDAYAKEAASGRGYAEDLLQVAAAAMGWGYEGSTGRARDAGGMSSLEGLAEGFKRL